MLIIADMALAVTSLILALANKVRLKAETQVLEEMGRLSPPNTSLGVLLKGV